MLDVPLPPVRLLDNTGAEVDLALVTLEPTVLFTYPGTDISPERPQDPDGLLSTGCTVQSLGFGERCEQFAERDVRVLGVSSLSVARQLELAERDDLPFSLLSDPRLELADALGLPTFRSPDGRRRYQRLALFAAEGAIERVFHPVPVPRRSAIDVLSWLSMQGLAA